MAIIDKLIFFKAFSRNEQFYNKQLIAKHKLKLNIFVIQSKQTYDCLIFQVPISVANTN
ncbi:hypothetical protein Smp_103600 [Schistosoma mansoni]|uniref:hypothetical protein n=1 Tax=Schistosoma mansoni TaxID=6183 RepID=UPI00022DC911|nr:hypothetical protein Smp_103600 [Schistosoma mansoni]|eukprot:XP_018647490.1 hypothetical protein Smp_103600 [Schistosoma mansoni]